MADHHESKLIDDSGIHIDDKVKQISFFVGLCRVFTLILALLGIGALLFDFLWAT